MTGGCGRARLCERWCQQVEAEDVLERGSDMHSPQRFERCGAREDAAAKRANINDRGLRGDAGQQLVEAEIRVSVRGRAQGFAGIALDRLLRIEHRAQGSGDYLRMRLQKALAGDEKRVGIFDAPRMQSVAQALESLL